MLNLIRFDLYRTTRGLRGEFAQLAIGITLLFALMFAIVRFTMPPEGYLSMQATMQSSLTNMWSNVFNSGGLFVLACSILALSITASGDYNGGFVKSLVPSFSGRLSYFAAKILFAGIASAIMLVLCIAASTVFGIGLLGIRPAAQPLAEIVCWLVLSWLSGWTFSVLVLAYYWTVPYKVLAYFMAFIFSTGTIRELVIGIAYSSGGILRVLQPVAPALLEAANWMPSAMFHALSGGQPLLSTPAVGALSSTLPGGLAAQTTIIGIGWLALATIVSFAVARRRDI